MAQETGWKCKKMGKKVQKWSKGDAKME